MQADIDYIKSLQNQKTYRFEIEPVKGSLSKFDRINRLVPLVSEGRFYMPTVLHRTSSEGRLEDQIHLLVEQEFLAWPVPAHDDGLDAIARIFDLDTFVFPTAEAPPTQDDRYNRRARRGSWMGR